MAVELHSERYLSADQAKKLIKEQLPQWISESSELRLRLANAFDIESGDRLSYQDFLSQDGDHHAEWVNGVVVEMSPPSTKHQVLVRFLCSLMQTYAEEHDLGVVIPAPFQMKLQNGREPDILYIAAEHLDRLTELYLDGPADIAVEVISPESVARDRGEKFSEYADGGVLEYWLIDPRTHWAEFFRLDDGFYRPVFTGGEGVYHSQALAGFWLNVAWLWSEPLPRTLTVLRELDLID